MFDRNGDGKISRRDLSESLEKLGIHIPKKELTRMIEKIDANDHGFMDVEEFGELYAAIMEDGDRRDEEEDMREVFNVFDSWMDDDNHLTLVMKLISCMN